MATIDEKIVIYEKRIDTLNGIIDSITSDGTNVSVKDIRKGDFSAKYRTTDDIFKEIEALEDRIRILKTRKELQTPFYRVSFL